MNRLHATAIALFLAALCPSTVAGEETTTKHYDLFTESIDAKDTGALLEALHEQLTNYFGTWPKERLRLEVYASSEAYLAALKRDEQGEIKAGGYYSPGTKKAYLWVQPSEYFTRQLILHEATHQFHFLAATGNRKPACDWYTEGLAEYFGMHNWDGRELQTRVVPAVSLEDYPKAALKQFADLKEDLGGVATGRVPCDRPLAWSLVHYLAGRRPKEWRALAALLDSGTKPDEAWATALGDVDAAFVKDYRAWLDSHQQPLRVAWVAWQERGDQIEGKADTVVSAAFFKETPKSFDVDIEAVSGDLRAGIAFNMKGNDDYCLFQINRGIARVVQRTNGAWKILASARAPAAAGGPTMSYRRDGPDAVLFANGLEVFRTPAEGEVGLTVEGCCARFRLKR